MFRIVNGSSSGGAVGTGIDGSLIRKLRRMVVIGWLILAAGMLALFAFKPGVAHAGGKEVIPYTNSVEGADGLVLHVEGELVSMFHANVKLDDIISMRTSCGNTISVPTIGYGLMVRPLLTAVNADTGEVYRLRGHFKRSASGYVIWADYELCGYIWGSEFTDEVEIITPEAVRTYRLTFYMEVNLETGELFDLQVIDAELL